jgi:hypothetical protein
VVHNQTVLCPSDYRLNPCFNGSTHLMIGIVVKMKVMGAGRWNLQHDAGSSITLENT